MLASIFPYVEKTFNFIKVSGSVFHDPYVKKQKIVSLTIVNSGIALS
jgi:hypothetical protein